jgi:L-fucose/D-arabinose isomerase
MEMTKAEKIGRGQGQKGRGPKIGVFATCDPRIDAASRKRSANIVAMVADAISQGVKMPDGKSPSIVWTDILVDGEKQADQVARAFKAEGVSIIVCAPDTWAFPQLGLLSLLSHFPKDTPINLTCGNSAPKPGVVFTHAASGALAQMGRLCHINVGNWPDEGLNPQMSAQTAEALVDWCFAALTYQGLKGRRVVIFGHDSMGMETALAHIIETRNSFGLEITRLDMKLLADMLAKGSYSKAELKSLRAWIDKNLGKRLMLRSRADSDRFNQSLAMYLITRDLIKDLDGVGGGFMSQLEWGSDLRGIPLPVADAMESLFNSTFDHTGKKAVVPYATEADVQGLLTMLFFTWLSGGEPPLFMDFRKVWEGWELERLARKLKISGLEGDSIWERKGLVDGDNSGSASFDWAGKPGERPANLMKRISMPLADKGYFPGMGNSVTFVTPGGIEGIAGRLAYSSLSKMFSMVWDEACTIDLPDKLAQAVCAASTPDWPHTFVVPKYATMLEYKQYAPANHLHMTWNLKPARLQYWMDLANVLSATPWGDRPAFVPETDRPLPLLYVINSGENATKMMRK